MSDNESPIDKLLDDLHRRAELTHKARYECSRRLENHELWSQWTLATLVVGHLAIALILALDMEVALSQKAVHFSAVFLGVVVLTYSLLLGLGRHGVRAKEMHLCGLDLGRIARRLQALKGGSEATDAQYRECVDAYYDCLSKYENHSEADYSRAAYEYYSKAESATQDQKARSILLWTYRRHWFFQFSHYVVSIALVWSWVIYLLLPIARTSPT